VIVSLEHLTRKCGACDKRVGLESPLCHDCTVAERRRSRDLFAKRKEEYGSLDAYFDHLMAQARANDAMRKKL
jgi:hypothetical protein